ncbi:hypothetical protein BVG19_g275 [[Candida] boidinii]|nr:hypothetical protein BVG19_g275 [[Candida] boidinii]OWB53598.1 hypothetical protein B5S27_g5202 [[Candida] boidinii]
MSSSRKYYPGELSSDESDGDTEFQAQQQLTTPDLKNSDNINEETQSIHSPQRVLDYVNGYDDYESDAKDVVILPLETEAVSESSNTPIKPSIILANDNYKKADLSTPNSSNKSTNNKSQSPTTQVISTDHLKKSLDQLADDFNNYLSQGESDDNDEGEDKDEDKDEDEDEDQSTNVEGNLKSESKNSNIDIISQFEKNKRLLETSLYPDDTTKRNNRLSKIEPPKKAFAPGLSSASDSVSSPLNEKNQDSPVYSNPMTPIDQLNVTQGVQQPSYTASAVDDNNSFLSDHTDVNSNKTLKPNAHKDLNGNSSVDNGEYTTTVTGYSSSQPNSIVQTPEILNDNDFNNQVHPPAQLDEDPESDNAWKPEDDAEYSDSKADFEDENSEADIDADAHADADADVRSSELSKESHEVEELINDHVEQEDTAQKTEDYKEWKTDEELNGGHIVDDYYNTGSSDNEKDVSIGNDESHDHGLENLENIKEADVDQSFQMGDDNEGDSKHGNDADIDDDDDDDDDDENAWKPQSESNGLHRYESSGSLSTGMVSLNSSVKQGYEPSIQTTTTSSRVNTSSLVTPSKKSIATESEEDNDDEDQKVDDDNADADDVWKPDTEPVVVHSDLESTEKVYNDDAIGEDTFDPEYPMGLADGFRDKFIRSNSRHTVASSMHPGTLTRDNSVYTSSGSTLQGLPINAPGFQVMKNSPMPPIPTSHFALNNPRIPSNATTRSSGTLGSNSTLIQSTLDGDSASTASPLAGSAIRSNTDGSPLQASSSTNSSATSRIPTGYTYKSMIPSDIPIDLGKKKKNSMVSAASVINSNTSSPLSNNVSDDHDLKNVKSEDSQLSSNSKQRVTSFQSSTSSNEAKSSSSTAANLTEQPSSASGNTSLASGVMPSADIKSIMAINDVGKRIEELRKKREEFKNYDSGLSKLLKQITLNGTGVTDRYKDSSIGPNVSKAYQSQVSTTDINIDLERTKSKIKKTSRRFLGRFHGLNKNN